MGCIAGVLCVFLWIVYHSKRLSRGYDVITSLAPCLFLKTHRNEASEWVRERAKQQEESSLYRNNFFFFVFRSVWTQAWWWCYSCVLSLLILFFIFFFPHNYPMIAWLYNSFANITFFLLLVLIWFDASRRLFGCITLIAFACFWLLLTLARTL